MKRQLEYKHEKVKGADEKGAIICNICLSLLIEVPTGSLLLVS